MLLCLELIPVKHVVQFHNKNMEILKIDINTLEKCAMDSIPCSPLIKLYHKWSSKISETGLTSEGKINIWSS